MSLYNLLGPQTKDSRKESSNERFQAGPKRGSLKSAGKRQESAAFLQRSFFFFFFFFDVAVQFSFVAAQLLVKMTSALQKSKCCSATSAAELSENKKRNLCFARGMLQGWGLEEQCLGLAETAFK